MISKKKILKHIAAAINDMDLAELRRLHNNLIAHHCEKWTLSIFDDIKPSERWHLVTEEKKGKN